MEDGRPVDRCPLIRAEHRLPWVDEREEQERAEEAERRFTALRLSNIVVQIGDGGAGWPAQAPFDRIIVTAQAEMLPEVLLSQLREGGVMILPIVENGRDHKVLRLRRKANGVERESLMDARFVPLLDGLPSPADGN